METMRAIHSQRLHTVTQDENAAAAAFRAGKQFRAGERSILGGGGDGGNGLNKGRRVGGTPFADGASKQATPLSFDSESSRNGKKAVRSEAGSRRALGDITNKKEVISSAALGKSGGLVASGGSGGGDLKSSGAKGEKSAKFASGKEVKLPLQPKVKPSLPSSTDYSVRKGQVFHPLEPSVRGELRGRHVGGGPRDLGQLKAGEVESFVSRVLTSIDERADRYAEEGIEHCIMNSAKVAGLVEEKKKREVEEIIKPLLEFRTDYFPQLIRRRGSSNRLAHSSSDLSEQKGLGYNTLPQSPPSKSPSGCLQSWANVDLEEMADREAEGREKAPMFFDRDDDSVLPDIPVEPIFGHEDLLSIYHLLPCV